MKKTALVVLVGVLAIIFSVQVFAADEAKPLNLKDPKNLVSGRWECLKREVSTRWGNRVYDYIIEINKITDDGKAVGTYTSKWEKDEKPMVMEINSKIQFTPDGFIRLDCPSFTSAEIFKLDMQPDGSFILPNKVILKRVK
jgi:hypothetical protein